MLFIDSIFPSKDLKIGLDKCFIGYTQVIWIEMTPLLYRK